jgi:CheY-like chemotaxis protein
MSRLIAILEDNADRIRVMKEKLANRMSKYETFFTDDPATLIETLKARWDEVVAVSLDHDLYDRPDHTTELTGMIVADYLAECEPDFPVMIHSTNDRDSTLMQSKLLDREWEVSKVVPFDDTNWIGLMWYPELKKMVRKFNTKATENSH